MPLSVDRTDVVGTIWTLTDQQGTVRDLVGKWADDPFRLEHVTYTPFGVPTPTGGLSGLITTFYAGRELDPHTGLYFNRARWYDPTARRFLSEDPIYADINLYRYAGNNPINATDPSGLILESGWDLASLIVGGTSLVLSIESAWAGEGSWWDVGLDAVGVVVDVAALCIPGVPGGAGIGIKAYRGLSTTQKAVKALRTADQGINLYQSGAGLYRASGNIQDGNYWAAGLNSLSAGMQGLHFTTRLAGARFKRVTAGGTAQGPNRNYTPNVSGPRSKAEALDLARQHGIEIGDDVRIRFLDDEMMDDIYGEVYASYGHISGDYATRVGSADLWEGGQLHVAVRRSVLDSDQELLAVLAHEMHEVNALRDMLSEGRTIGFSTYANLVKPGIRGNLHDEAWDKANELLDKVLGDS